MLEQLAKNGLTLRFNSRSDRLLAGLGSQRIGYLNVDMLFGGAVLNLPAIYIPRHANNRDWSWPANDVEIASHSCSVTARLLRQKGRVASIFASALDTCSIPAAPELGTASRPAPD